ncbi:Leukotriene A-4 hydrolase [Acromyrmex echinatior]|uniref:Leukotriene A-4 hydrolase n=1 Tax=Acromyrmex echinatior TaxID=103372 RepID=F4WXD0_ACREC|nr:Leukotriene A-4 hydrolase [Acromyrmex echinatior]
MDLPCVDPYSYANPDIYQLNEDKMDVSEYFSSDKLKYDVKQTHRSVESEFVIIQIPQKYRGHFTEFKYKYYKRPYQIKYNCIIKIIYETRKDSPAMYWLRSDQTSDGSHPFLITNNKFTYARGIFPCQDSPSIRFTFAAEIFVPNNINSVIICGRTCKRITEDGCLHKFTFYETFPMPAYAMIIVVGSLETIHLDLQHNVSLWAEKKYIEQSKSCFANFHHILTIAKELCGPLYRRKLREDVRQYNICVLPPNIPEIELQCFSMIYVSSTLLNEDFFWIFCTVAKKVAQNWAGGLVTCKNFEHLWLNKSFSTFISRKIIYCMYKQNIIPYAMSFLERITAYTLINKFYRLQNYGGYIVCFHLTSKLVEIDIARIIHTHLELFVDFNETVLRGTAILFIEMEPEYDEIILDIYQLNEDKMDVLEYFSSDKLKYNVKQNRSVGSKSVIIRIPHKYRGRFTEYKYCNKPYQIDYNCAILIMYETRKDSPVLYWLRSDQTSDGTHPLLITNNKFTYARGIFPCQDSPSVRFTFTAEIPQKYRGRFTEFKYKYCNEPYQIDYNCAILIMYETRKDSPVLYWLRSDQTSDGTHPLLITNNKFTYARGIFPCQDSPSVRFTFTAEKLKSILTKWIYGPNLRHMPIEDICTLYPELHCLMTKSQGYLLATRWITTEAFNNFALLLNELKFCNNNLERREFLFHLYASNAILPVAKLWWLRHMFPLDEQTCENRYAILITYETRKDSPVLYWLRSDQTSDGTHPLLITNNKFTYARGIFPCQDSPSVRFTFTAEISVPNNFNTVIICGRTCRLIINDGDRHIYMCFEMFPMPSYAMIIMVGSLETIHLDLQHNVSLWAEKKYIEQSKSCFANFHHILTIAKELCGPIYINDKERYTSMGQGAVS